jgi:hypothetical protein
MSGRSAPSPPREPPGQDIDPWIPAPSREETLHGHWWRGKGFGIIAAARTACIKLNRDSTASILQFPDFGGWLMPDGVVCVSAEWQELMYAVLYNGDLAVIHVDHLERVERITDADAVGVASAGHRSVVLTTLGTIWTVRKDPVVGKVTLEQAHPEFAQRIVAVAIGTHHNVYLLEDGRIATAGKNDHSQLGTGDFIDHEDMPVILEWPHSFAAIDADTNMSGAVTREGQVVIWGIHTRGPLWLENGAHRAIGLAIGADVAIILNADNTLSYCQFAGMPIPRGGPEVIDIEDLKNVVAVVCDFSTYPSAIIAVHGDENLTILRRPHPDVFPVRRGYPIRTRFGKSQVI